MENINPRYRFNEILDLYKSRIFWSPVLVEKEILDIGNKEEFATSLINTANQLASRYLNIENEVNAVKTKERNGEKTDYVILNDVMNLKYVVTKSFFKRKWGSWNPSEKLGFKLQDSNRGPENCEVWELIFLPFDLTYDLDHRWIKPCLQNQGQWIGTLFLKSAESFLAKLSGIKWKDITIRADVGQLNVMLWFLKNWYQFETKEDEERFNAIVNGNKNLCIWEDYYIFSKDVPASERIASNRLNAKNVAFKKVSSQNNDAGNEIDVISKSLNFPQI